MTIYICGGSNSLLKDGWVPGLAAHLGRDEELKNISVGAAPSQMGAYRCIHTVDIKRGDTVIWEYGVNDANHIDQRGYNARELLRSVEWIIRHCRDRGANFAAMIFQPNNREKKMKVTAYRKMVHSLCDHYGVGYFDLPLAYLERNPGAKRIPRRYFQGNAHYKTNSDLMELIVEGALELVKSAQVPAGKPKRKLGALKACTGFAGGEAEVFENRVIEVETFRPGARGLECRTERPGRLVGLLITSTPKGGVFDVSIGNETFRVSATYREKKYNKTMVKFVSLPVLAEKEISFEAGTPITITWAESSEGMLADFRFKKKVGRKAISAREAGVVAVLTEERGPAKSAAKGAAKARRLAG